MWIIMIFVVHIFSMRSTIILRHTSFPSGSASDVVNFPEFVYIYKYLIHHIYVHALYEVHENACAHFVMFRSI